MLDGNFKELIVVHAKFIETAKVWPFKLAEVWAYRYYENHKGMPFRNPTCCEMLLLLNDDSRFNLRHYLLLKNWTETYLLPSMLSKYQMTCAMRSGNKLWEPWSEIISWSRDQSLKLNAIQYDHTTPPFWEYIHGELNTTIYWGCGWQCIMITRSMDSLGQ